jgi:hypothetical protein
MSTVFNLEAEMVGGSTFTVQADQRDIAEFECEPYGVSFYQITLRPNTFLRYLAWRAGKRNRLHQFPTYEAFKDECLSVTNLDKAKGAEAPEADPGSPAASAEV